MDDTALLLLLHCGLDGVCDNCNSDDLTVWRLQQCVIIVTVTIVTVYDNCDSVWQLWQWRLWQCVMIATECLDGLISVQKHLYKLNILISLVENYISLNYRHCILRTICLHVCMLWRLQELSKTPVNILLCVWKLYVWWEHGID